VEKYAPTQYTFCPISFSTILHTSLTLTRTYPSSGYHTCLVFEVQSLNLGPETGHRGKSFQFFLVPPVKCW